MRMGEFRLLELGYMGWKQSQLVYHALAEMGAGGVVLQRSAHTYFCLGMFSPLEDLDLEFVRRRGVPLFRRAIGGGTVLLDREQLFYHVVVPRDSELAPVRTSTLYRRFLKPVIQTYGELGVKATYRPASDIVAEGRKVSGNGAGVVGDCLVLSGSMLLDFNFELMAGALNLPAHLRQRALELMRERLGTLRMMVEEVDVHEVQEVLAGRFEDLFGGLEVGRLSLELLREMRRIEPRYTSHEWLHQGRKSNGLLKIAEGCYLVHLRLGGVELSAELHEGVVRRVRAQGEEGRMRELEDALEGCRAERQKILNILAERLGCADDVVRAAQALSGG